MKIFLDDVRTAPEGEGYTTCRTVAEVIEHLFFTKETIEEISLDHDLGEDTDTGYKLVCFIEARIARCDYPFDGSRSLPLMNIHSANPVGRANMVRGIDSCERLAAERQRKNPADLICTGNWNRIRDLDVVDDTVVTDDEFAA